MSLDTGPNLRALWHDRSRLLLLYAPQMQVDELFTVRHQLRTIWASAPKERPALVETAHTLNRVSTLAWSLGDDKAAMTELEKIERDKGFR
jgi:hypothetical protein